MITGGNREQERAAGQGQGQEVNPYWSLLSAHLTVVILSRRLTDLPIVPQRQ
jgi:hypothetical protein